MLGCGSAGKLYFVSLLVIQLAPWIQCVFHGNNKVHRANEAQKQLGFALLSYLGHMRIQGGTKGPCPSKNLQKI